MKASKIMFFVFCIVTLFIVALLIAPELAEAEEIIRIYGCDRLNVSNSRYVLQADIIVNGSCFRIDANNLVFDLNNHSIKHTEASPKNPLSYGISVSGRTNVEVINGFISGFGRGVFVSDSKKIKISKIGLSTDGFFGNSTTIAMIYVDKAEKLEANEISISNGRNQ